VEALGLRRMWQPIAGGFVWTGDRLGIGKLVDLEGPNGEVEFNHSAVRAEKGTYPLASLRRAYLPLQTRVYYRRGDEWLLGRVLERYVEGSKPASYLIRFPGYQPAELPEAELRVRCLLPLADPTEVLAAGAVEGQFLADRRTAVLEQLAVARRVSRSLGGLLSASVELLPHQVEVVRRVTEDPIQRYLLADEVGLGKTIEAGAIVAQAALDHPDDRVVIAVPRSLLRQWQDELLRRFGLDREGLNLISFDRLAEVDGGETDFLVIDEVHHLVTGSSEAASGYEQLRHLAHSVPRLLLLSATPVLGDSKSTLALLHLLDPEQYRLEELAAFERLLANRQEFGRVLLSLNVDAAALILRRAVTKLGELAPVDEDARHLGQQLMAALSNGDVARVAAAVRSLRDHVTETYRLNRRLLRTRRRDTEGWELAVRRSDLTIEVDEDARIAEAWDALEEWRYRAAQSVHGDGGLEAVQSRQTVRALIGRYVDLFEALGRGVDAFIEAVQSPSAGPSFPEEEEIRRRVMAIPPEGGDGSDRVSLAAAIIDLTLRGTVPQSPGAPPKVVGFTSRSSFVSQLTAELARLRGVGVCHVVTSDLGEDSVERAVRAFRQSRVPSVLLTDLSGEEGLNLQFVDAVIHLDVPLDPMRIEQRIGRLDRIGRRGGSIRHRVMIPSDEDGSPWLAWLEVLRAGLKIFDESIADIQFALDGILDEARVALFRSGAVGLQQFVSRSRDLVTAERQRLDEQYALDRLEMGEADAHILFSQLTEAEKSDRELASSMTSWWHDVLRLDRSISEEAPDGTFRLSWTDSTLAPREPWHDAIASILDAPLTFERGVALSDLGTRLVRSGNPLVEVLPRFLRYDDRGTAFITWRMEASWPTADAGPWMGFKLVYVVELDAEAIAMRLWAEPDPVGTAALQRRADVLFPPWVETHFVDTSLATVTDARLRAILARPYQKDSTRRGTRDFNLAGRLGVLNGLADPNMIARWCADVRESAADLVRQQPTFERRLADAHARADRELAVQRERLNRRRAAQNRDEGSRDSTLDLEIAMATEILSELESPTVRLDSVGLFVVSDAAPTAGVAG
jgi:ATP-dependent helicase HepA